MNAFTHMLLSAKETTERSRKSVQLSSTNCLVYLASAASAVDVNKLEQSFNRLLFHDNILLKLIVISCEEIEGLL